MVRFDNRETLFATALSALAGFVDATGFLKLGGFFVSFMSGNSTRLAVGLIRVPHYAAIASGLIAIFVIGVVVGALIGHHGRHNRPALVLLVIAGLLAGAALADVGGFVAVAAGLMTLAMGVENAVFEQEGDVRVGLTYMTGTLVRVGQGIAGILRGHSHWNWAPNLVLWIGFVAGGCTGAALFARFGLGSLWLAALFSALLALLWNRIIPERDVF